jgi:nitrogen fixation protein FixH
MAATSPTRNPWPVAIVSFFILFSSGLTAFIVFAAHQHVDLVRPDYYEQEIRFQEQLDRANRAQLLPQPAAIAYDQAQHCITVKLPPAHTTPSSGRICLYRPSDAKLDQEIPLTVDGEGAQRIDAGLLRSGLWKVRVQWTVSGQEYYCDRAIVVLAPPHS